jgi:bacterioferritin
MDKHKVIKKLNEALERELAEVVKYMHQSFWVQGPTRKKMIAFFREQSQESMGHAIRLGEKIVDMGGTPVVKILEIYEPKAQSMRQMLLECVEDERKAKEGYEKMLPLVEGDRELSRLIKGLALEEAGHMDEIEAMAKKAGRA